MGLQQGVRVLHNVLLLSPIAMGNIRVHFRIKERPALTVTARVQVAPKMEPVTRRGRLPTRVQFTGLTQSMCPIMYGKTITRGITPERYTKTFGSPMTCLFYEGYPPSI